MIDTMDIVELQTESLNLTEEQFFRFCVENKGLRIERDKNKTILIMSPTGGETGNVNFKLAAKVEVWNERENKGYGFDSNTGFTLPNGAMRMPDVSWIPKEKWEALPKEDREKFAHICPDFVIELMSKSDHLKRTMEKMEEWKANGCRLGWLINPATRTTLVYRPNADVLAVPFDETLSGGDVMVGFELLLEKIIA